MRFWSIMGRHIDGYIYTRWCIEAMVTLEANSSPIVTTRCILAYTCDFQLSTPYTLLEVSSCGRSMTIDLLDLRDPPEEDFSDLTSLISPFLDPSLSLRLSLQTGASLSFQSTNEQTIHMTFTRRLPSRIKFTTMVGLSAGLVMTMMKAAQSAKKHIPVVTQARRTSPISSLFSGLNVTAARVT